jgi:hypothetical protein
MVVLLHGAAGGWDEVAIAVAAFAILWVAIKLAGRRPANVDEDEDENADDAPASDTLRTEATSQEHTDPTSSSSKPA